ncbi:MAG: CARDB domain-containing protein [Dehalococcoidia bacterium]|jgi:hypothetical protein
MKIVIITLICLAIGALAAGEALAVASTITPGLVSSSGGTSNSASYSVNGIAGQPATGLSQSQNFGIFAGFITGMEYPSQPPPFPTTTNILTPEISTMISTTPHGSSMPATIAPAPMQLPNLLVQSASLSTSKVLPGTLVTVTANIANKGTVNGSTRIKLYVNGEEDSSQGVTVESGGSRQVYFTVNRSQPGTYDVYVGGVQAGTFMVENEIDPNIILLCSCTLILISLALGIVYVLRRRNYSY